MHAHDAVKVPYHLWVAVALTWVAGFVDIVGYIVLYRVFAANMTGNTIALGQGLAAGDWGLFFRRGFAIPMFVLGLIVSRLVLHLSQEKNASRAASVLFGAEILLLVTFTVIGSQEMSQGRIRSEAGWKYYLLVALPSIAMGLQNATLTHFGPLTVRTTHVTGTLANLADELVQYLVWLKAHIGSAGSFSHAVRDSRAQPSLRAVCFLAGVWLSYCAGAALGACLERPWQLLSLVLPLAILSVMILVLLCTPPIVGSSARGSGRWPPKEQC
jgi:uncharacterized membrane protein YoaK (UPF0700 family)